MNSQVQFPRLTFVNKTLIIASVALFILDAVLIKAANMSLIPLLGLSVEGVARGFIYQPLTYSFISRGLMDVIFHALGLWFVGSELEEMWGRRRYVSFLVGVVLGGALLYLLVGSLFFTSGALSSFALTGLSGAVMALFLAYAILYPNRPFLFMFVFSLPAKYFCAILIAMSLYFGLFTVGGVGAWGHLGSMAMAVVMMKLMSHPSTKHFFVSSPKSRTRGAHLKIVPKDGARRYNNKDDDGNPPPKYFQ